MAVIFHIQWAWTTVTDECWKGNLLMLSNHEWVNPFLKLLREKKWK